MKWLVVLGLCLVVAVVVSIGGSSPKAKHSQTVASNAAAAAEAQYWTYGQRAAWADKYPADPAEAQWLKSFEDNNMPRLTKLAGGTYGAVERVRANPNEVQIQGAAWRLIPAKAQRDEQEKWQEYFRRKGFGDQVAIEPRI